MPGALHRTYLTFTPASGPLQLSKPMKTNV